MKSIDRFNEKYGDTDFGELTLLSYFNYIDIQKDENNEEYIAVYSSEDCDCTIEDIYDKNGNKQTRY